MRFLGVFRGRGFGLLALHELLEKLAVFELGEVLAADCVGGVVVGLGSALLEFDGVARLLDRLRHELLGGRGHREAALKLGVLVLQALLVVRGLEPVLPDGGLQGVVMAWVGGR